MLLETSQKRNDHLLTQAQCFNGQYAAASQKRQLILIQMTTTRFLNCRLVEFFIYI
jgi:hypothetical protein